MGIMKIKDTVSHKDGFICEKYRKFRSDYTLLQNLAAEGNQRHPVPTFSVSGLEKSFVSKILQTVLLFKAAVRAI